MVTFLLNEVDVDGRCRPLSFIQPFTKESGIGGREMRTTLSLDLLHKKGGWVVGRWVVGWGGFDFSVGFQKKEEELCIETSCD